MTDTPTTPELENETGQTETGQTATGRPSAGGGRAGLFALVLVLMAISAGTYWVMLVFPQDREKLSRAIDEVAARNSDAEVARSSLDGRIDEAVGAVDSIDARVTDFSRTIDTLDQAVKGLYARESQSTLDWQLAEVEYLVFAATQRLILHRDVETALAALKAADERIATAAHPELSELRSQLARDIAALDGVVVPDTEGLAIYLAEAVARVTSLPTKPVADIDMSFSRMSDETARSNDWRGYLQAMWIDLKGLVEIKDGKLEDSVLFDPELRYFLVQNLRLELASARLAVLKGDTANFRAAVSLVRDLLRQYYDIEDGQVAAMLKDLEGYSMLELAPAVPSIGSSLDAVRAKRQSLRNAAMSKTKVNQ